MQKHQSWQEIKLMGKKFKQTQIENATEALRNERKRTRKLN